MVVSWRPLLGALFQFQRLVAVGFLRQEGGGEPWVFPLAPTPRPAFIPPSFPLPCQLVANLSPNCLQSSGTYKSLIGMPVSVSEALAYDLFRGDQTSTLTLAFHLGRPETSQDTLGQVWPALDTVKCFSVLVIGQWVYQLARWENTFSAPSEQRELPAVC